MAKKKKLNSQGDSVFEKDINVEDVLPDDFQLVIPEELRVEIKPDGFDLIEEEEVDDLDDCFDEIEDGTALGSFEDNLAEHLEENYLNQIGEDIIKKVEADTESRGPWLERYKRGIESLGIVNTVGDVDSPFEGASDITYPLLMDGIVQFQARALAEIFPASGPVKAQLLGDVTTESEEQATRVEDYLNYQILNEDKAYFDEVDQMLLYLPIAGSAFKKTYYDPILDTVVSKFIKPEDFIVPYTATCMEDSPRYTHVVPYSQNALLRLQKVGFYRKTSIDEPREDSRDINTESSRELIDEIDGKIPQLSEGDDRHRVLESYIEYDLEGFEDEDEHGNPSGIALPYIISVDYHSGKTLSIRRNWKENDEHKRRRDYVSHYKYLPGLGFYGFGLYHLIGGLSDSATGAIRALLDSAAFATMQGGFKAKDINPAAGGDVTLTPGVYTDMGMTSDELQRAFYTPPFKEPSMALFRLLELLISAGKETASITEARVGSGGANTPVGTELARIEQGSKVHTAIHKRIHKAAANEFKLRAELNHEFLGDEPYPYNVIGATKEIRGSDFDDRIDILPVSDPNISSASLRIAQAQSVMQMAGMSPELYDMYSVHKRMLEAQGINNIDEILPNRKELPMLDVISELQAIMMQKDVKAHAEQDHTAHIKVISAFMEHPSFGGDPYIKELTMPRVLGLLAEHKAYELGQIFGQAGSQVPMVDLSVDGNNILLEDYDDVEGDDITQSALQVMEQFMQIEGGKITPDNQAEQIPPEQQKIQAELQVLQAKTQADLASKQALAQADIANKDSLLQSEIARKDQAAKSEQERKDYELDREESRKDVEMSNKISRESE